MNEIGATIEIPGGMTHLRFQTNAQMVNQLRHVVHTKMPDFWRKTLSYIDVRYIVDVGANIGAVSMMFHFAFPDADILALEPSKTNYAYLEYNIKKFPKIDIMNLGAYSRPGYMPLSMPSPDQRPQLDVEIDTENFGLLSLYGKGAHQEMAKVDCLDNIVSRPVDILKIDVEGAELDVLHGATRIMREDQPVVLMELHSENLRFSGRRKEDYQDFFKDMNYESLGTYFSDVLLAPRRDHDKHFYSGEHAPGEAGVHSGERPEP